MNTSDRRTIENTNEVDEEIKAAAARLKAVRLADGRYAYRADETHSWWLVTADDLADLGSDEDYSEWCSSSDGEEVSDLDHDTLDAICEAGGDAEHDYRCQCGPAMGERCAWTGDREELLEVRWVPDSDRGSARASGTYARGAYAETLYVTEQCADDISYVWEDGAKTEELDPYVHVVGPAYV